LLFFWALLADFTLLTPTQHTHPRLLPCHRRRICASQIRLIPAEA
jgi:hypothetical protein